jgi:serine/threonine protein kinase
MLPQIKRFARKIPKESFCEDHKREWDTHIRLANNITGPASNHIMPALGAYLHGDIFFILMEDADCSLQKYLSTTNQDQYDSEGLWQQAEGLSRGLAALHSKYEPFGIKAYHQDLKPANILIIRGIMKIADFGLLEFKTDVTADSGDTDASGVPKKFNTGSYRAPGNRATREADVWSLACIFSELATSDIQGMKEVEQYRALRRQDTDNPSGKDEPKFFARTAVKKSVLNRHEILRNLAKNAKDGTITDFQKRFYCDKFFVLLNSMFQHSAGSGEMLGVPTTIHAPEAKNIMTELRKLREEASKPVLPLGPEGIVWRPKLPNIWDEIHDDTDEDCPKNIRLRL